MKQFIAHISRILNHNEKVKLGALALLDLVICALDIAFLGGLLLVVNYYTSANATGNFYFFNLRHNSNSLLLISIFFLLFGLKNMVGYFISAAENSFFYEVATRLSRQNILHYLKDDYIKFVHTDSSVHIRKIRQQPVEFSSYILINIQQVITQSVLILFTVIAILLYHPVLFLLLFIILLPPVVLLAYIIKNKLSKVRANTKSSGEKAIQHLQESLAGFIESNIYHKDDFFINRYHGYQKQLNENISTQQSLQGLPSRLIEIFAVLGFFILIVISKISPGANAINLLNVGVFMAASYKIIPGIVKILNSTGQIKTYQFVLDDLVKSDEDIKEKSGAAPISPINSVEFNQVRFKYKHNELLNGLSFALSPGDFAGISGSSGRGKTTIINLLLGFLQQDSGSILINHTITDYFGRQQYWPKISYVKQQTFFINDTILKNITLTDDGYDDKKLTKALSFCGINKMLAQYPEGINKIITENGKNISGGQRQRMMLARALYHDFDVLILDEPFGELDEISERAILGQLALLAQQGKMIILVTHNKASLTFCNKMILLDE